MSEQCQHCQTQVSARADGTCPACRQMMSGPPMTVATDAPNQAPSGAKKTPIVGPILGVVVAAAILNAKRHGASQMLLVEVGAALVGGVIGVFAVRWMMGKLRSSK